LNDEVVGIWKKVMDSFEVQAWGDYLGQKFNEFCPCFS